MQNNVQIILLLTFSFIYVFLQEIKRLMVKEMDQCLYKEVIEYFLSGEYYLIGLTIMTIANFCTLNVAIGFISMFFLRFLYNKLLYSRIYNKFSRKIKRYNIYNK